MKFLIVGLGNPGVKYDNTRHNIGFKALDYVAKQTDALFVSSKYFRKQPKVIVQPSIPQEEKPTVNTPLADNGSPKEEPIDNSIAEPPTAPPTIASSGRVAIQQPTFLAEYQLGLANKEKVVKLSSSNVKDFIIPTSQDPLEATTREKGKYFTGIRKSPGSEFRTMEAKKLPLTFSFDNSLSSPGLCLVEIFPETRGN